MPRWVGNLLAAVILLAAIAAVAGFAVPLVIENQINRQLAAAGLVASNITIDSLHGEVEITGISGNPAGWEVSIGDIGFAVPLIQAPLAVLEGVGALPLDGDAEKILISQGLTLLKLPDMRFSGLRLQGAAGLESFLAGISARRITAGEGRLQLDYGKIAISQDFTGLTISQLDHGVIGMITIASNQKLRHNVMTGAIDNAGITTGIYARGLNLVTLAQLWQLCRAGAGISADGSGCRFFQAFNVAGAAGAVQTRRYRIESASDRQMLLGFQFNAVEFDQIDLNQLLITASMLPAPPPDHWRPALDEIVLDQFAVSRLGRPLARLAHRRGAIGADCLIAPSILLVEIINFPPTPPACNFAAPEFTGANSPAAFQAMGDDHER